MDTTTLTTSDANTTAIIESGIFQDGYITYFGISISIYVAIASLLCCCSSILLIAIGCCVVKLRRRKRDAESLRTMHQKVHHDRVSTKSKSKLIAIDMKDPEEEEREPIPRRTISRSRARSKSRRRYKRREKRHSQREQKDYRLRAHSAQSDAMTSDGEGIDMEPDEFIVSADDTDSVQSGDETKEEPEERLVHRKITEFVDDDDDPNEIPDNLMNRNWRKETKGNVTKGGVDKSHKSSTEIVSQSSKCKSEGLARIGAVRGNYVNPKDEELSTSDYYRDPMP